MDEESNLSGPQPPGGNSGSKVLWLLAAFIPSLIGVLLLTVKAAWPLFPILLIGNFICSLFSSIALASDIKGDGLRFISGFLLAIALFIMNVTIVVFVGCSGMRHVW